MIKIISVGKIKEKYLVDLIEDYKTRITKYQKIEIIELKDSNKQKENEEILRVLNEKDFDVIIVIDSLTTNSIFRLNHVIQITDTGLVPGSGVNNRRKEFTKDSLKVPLISIGIATVISLNSIYQELLTHLDINKKIRLKEEDNLMLTIKEIETRIEILTSLISDALNSTLNP